MNTDVESKKLGIYILMNFKTAWSKAEETKF